VRPVIKLKKPHYEVKWKGYNDKDNTIEPREQLLEDVPKLVHKYEKEFNVYWYPHTVQYDK
jgi:hypothetical protein